jgi:CubicO group peptidase (beta-lactamase class C family)
MIIGDCHAAFAVTTRSNTESNMDTRKRYRIFLTLICLILMLALAIYNAKSSSMQPEEIDFAAIDAYIMEQMNDLGVPGMALGIVEDSQIAHLQGYGIADSSGRTITPQTPFYIGSVTKSFTALAVMQLVEAGKIDLDASVQEYLPWFELADKEASAKITVRNLLNHASGISEKDGNRFWASKQGLEEFVRGFHSVELAQPVGSTYQYSNINFGIAGLIVAKVSGQSYADYVTEHILEPLDMRHSTLSRESALTDGLSQGHYDMIGRPFTLERAISPAGIPSGGLIASAEDMSHYVLAQLNEGIYGDMAVLSPQGIQELHASAVAIGPDTNYAIGWNSGTVDGISAVWHGGNLGNFTAFVIMTPDLESGIVLLANTSGYEMYDQIAQVALGVHSLLNGRSAVPVVPLPFYFRFLYWAILLTPFLQILGIILVWRNRQRIKGWGAVLIVIVNLAVVFLLLGLSQLIPFPLSSMLVFYPELGYGLIAVAALGIGWSVIYTVMCLRAQRSE